MKKDKDLIIDLGGDFGRFLIIELLCTLIGIVNLRPDLLIKLDKFLF